MAKVTPDVVQSFSMPSLSTPPAEDSAPANEVVGLCAPDDAPKKAQTDLTGMKKAQTDGAGMSAARSMRCVKILEKVKDPAVKTDWVVEEEVEIKVKMMLVKWDKDQDGSFSYDEVQEAMAELENSEKQLAQMKWKMIFVFGFILLLGMLMGGILAIVMIATKETEVKGKAGEMRAPNPATIDAKVPEGTERPTELTATTQSRGNIDLSDILLFSNATDQWTINDNQLRDLDDVGFWGQNLSYYHFDVAEIIRVDSGKNGINDKLDILTTSGCRLRWWEDVGDLEVKWPGTTMWTASWSLTQPTGGRRLMTETEAWQSQIEGSTPDWAQEERMLASTEDEEGHDLAFIDGKDQPHERRLGKGGVVVFYGGGAGGARHGTSSSECNGWCNVPENDFAPCTNWCKERMCYSWGTQTYRCHAGASSLGICGVAVLLIVRAFIYN